VSAFYAELETVAAELLREFGSVLGFSRTAPNGAVTAWNAAGVRVDSVKHVESESGVAIGDERFLFAANANPKHGDRVSVGGRSFVVIHSDPIRPADTVLAWWIWLRR
jgi:hypothetical protein